MIFLLIYSIYNLDDFEQFDCISPWSLVFFF